MDVAREVKMLVEHIKRLGEKDADGNYAVAFGVLFNDDICANEFEALGGTLKAAKKKKIIKYDSEILLQNVHDKVMITLLQDL